MKLPERLVGLVIAADGHPVGVPLPSLDERGAMEAWRKELGPGPYYVRFADRHSEASLDRVQRLARLGEVWLDCPIPHVDAALDLLVAGAARLVLRGDDAELLEAVGDSAVVAWDGHAPLDAAIALAKPHDIPILASATLPATDDPGLYQAPPGPWTQPFVVRYVGDASQLADDEDPEANAAAPTSEDGDAAR